MCLLLPHRGPNCHVCCWNLWIRCTLLEEGKDWRLYSQGPMVVGHESSGTVSAVGEGVTDLKVGKL